jgi:23S rRNA (cytosine1962-C5)-methyltransferase
MWTYDPQEQIDEQFFQNCLSRAISSRSQILKSNQTNALRLVHAESDGLPGIIFDKYDDLLVLQCLTTGAEFWRNTIVEIITSITGITRLFERSDADVRHLEGLPNRIGAVCGEFPSSRHIIRENELQFYVDFSTGQKTGFYLDQRRNRQIVQSYSAGRNTLNCFCYTGAFTAYALAGNASHVLSVDSSAEAINLAMENIALNHLPANRTDWQQGDVFDLLRLYRDQARKFDLIILDPPKFAPTAAQAEKAARGYKDINLLAFKLLNPGGLLATFSCSGGISSDLFQKIIAGAAWDAKVDARILEHFSQSSDHPISLNFPQGEYLKGLLCQV